MHELLSKIEQELKGLPAEEVVEIGGHKYGLRLLDRADESAAARFIKRGADGLIEFVDAIDPVPVIACSLASIDGIPVQTIFGIEDESELRTAVHAWLLKRPGLFVDRLATGYSKLKASAAEVLSGLAPL